MAYLLSDWQAGKLPPKGFDVADAVDFGWTSAEIEAFMRATAQPWTPESAPERAADGPSRVVAHKLHLAADRLSGGASGAGAMAHPDVIAMMQRIALLRGSGKVSVDEHARLTSCGESLAILAQWYEPDLDALLHRPLPDPGLRPDVSTIHPFAGSQRRNLPMALGYKVAALANDRDILHRARAAAASKVDAAALAEAEAMRAAAKERALERAARLLAMAQRTDALAEEFRSIVRTMPDVEKELWAALREAGEPASDGIVGRRNLVTHALNAVMQAHLPLRPRGCAEVAAVAWGFLLGDEDI